jgi:hypothetical protein
MEEMKQSENTVNAYVQGKMEVLKTFSVKGYKSWTAREGVGAQTTLYKDGEKIGLCTDEGNGGEVSLDASGEGFRMVKDFLATLPEYKFADMWKEQYGEDWDGEEDPYLKSWKVHLFADVMLEQAEEEKQLKKLCKTKLVVRIEGEQDFTVFNPKWPKDTYGQLALMSQLTKQLQPKVITEFVNKRFD